MKACRHPPLPGIQGAGAPCVVSMRGFQRGEKTKSSPFGGSLHTFWPVRKYAPGGNRQSERHIWFSFAAVPRSFDSALRAPLRMTRWGWCKFAGDWHRNQCVLLGSSRTPTPTGRRGNPVRIRSGLAWKSVHSARADDIRPCGTT